MKKLRFLPGTRALTLIGALAFGAVAFFASRQHLEAREHELEARLAERHATVRVLVPTADLRAGDVVAPDRLAARRIPARYLPASAARAEDVERVVGQRVLDDVRSGEPLLWPLLAGPEGPAFSAGLDAGRRALTFPVDDVNAVAGMLVPGDVIDLLYTDARASGRPTVRPLLQRVTVLATGTTTRRRGVADAGDRSRETPMQFATITLSVTPDEAQLIVLAQRSGELTAVLRHPSDAVALPARTVDASALDGEPLRRRVPRAPVDYVHFITGGSRGVARGVELPLPADPSGRPAGRVSTGDGRAPVPAIDAGDVRARLGLTPPSSN
jgi:pilus assembly protein CpaB